MFDLLERKGSALDLVPVPLPGRVVLFAGPQGVPMVRSADGAVRSFGGVQGVPGVGFRDIKKLPAAAVHERGGMQLIAQCNFAPGSLLEGDVVTLHAPVFVTTPGVRWNVWARMNAGAWVPLFAGLRIAPAAGVRLWGVVSGDDLRVVARCTANTVGNDQGKMQLDAGEGSGMDVVEAARLTMGALAVLEVAIEWTGQTLPQAGSVAVAPVTVRVL